MQIHRLLVNGMNKSDKSSKGLSEARSGGACKTINSAVQMHILIINKMIVYICLSFW